MISSVQTDEARHSQQGGPTLEILVEHDPVRAQWVVDKSFWGSARAFAALTGPAMDYYTPLEHRKQSYREFMEEWIIDQFIHTIEDYGLKKPWYWDEFMRGLDIWHHGLHMGLWYWRPTLWWRPKAAVSTDEREWLAEKYPNWEKVYGDKWDVIIDNVNANNMEATLPETLPWLCSTCHLPCCNATQSRDGTWRVRDCQLAYDGRIYHFCTNGCRQIFWKDRDNVNHETLVDRFLAGQIQPMDVGGILGYMGLTPDVMGDDPDYEAWTKDYACRRPRASPRRPGHERQGMAAGRREDRAPELVPLNAIFATDFVQILVPVTTANTMREVAAAVAHHVEGKRVRALPYHKVVIHNGERLPDGMTVAAAGIKPLDHVTVEYDIPEGS